MSHASSSRREFLKTTSAITLGGLGLAGTASTSLLANTHRSPAELEQGAVVLFQGDSITDAGRDRETDTPNSQSGLGTGYAFLAAAELLEAYPEKQLKCYNKGVSGDKVFQLSDRWQEDCLALQPDVLSILIGVNDFWHMHKHNYDGTLETYEGDLRRLLDRTLETLPDVQLILGEPFVLSEGSAISDDWFPKFNQYQKAARRISEEYNTAFVPYQSVFEEASQSVPKTYWSADGVHPSTAGCQLMAKAWLETFQSISS